MESALPVQTEASRYPISSIRFHINLSHFLWFPKTGGNNIDGDFAHFQNEDIRNITKKTSSLVWLCNWRNSLITG